MDTLNLLILACRLAANLWVTGFWQCCKCRHLLKGRLSSLDFCPGNKNRNSPGHFVLCEAVIVCKKFTSLCVTSLRCGCALPRGSCGLDCDNADCRSRPMTSSDDRIRQLCTHVSSRSPWGYECSKVTRRALELDSSIRELVLDKRRALICCQVVLWCKFPVAPCRWF